MPAVPANTAPSFTPEGQPQRLRVLLPLPLEAAYSYLAPRDLALRPGDLVAVPLGRRTSLGVVWEVETGEPPVAPARLKEVLQRYETPPLPEVTRRFLAWVSGYTLAPPGAVLRMALPPSDALAPPQARRALRLAAEPPAGLRVTPARQRVLGLAADGLARSPGELAREAGVGPAVVRGLLEAGALSEVELPQQRLAEPDWRRPGPELSPPQAEAAVALRAAVAEGAFSATLLEGVTGSGKTEVYFEAVAAALAAGRQVLVLLPEIALTAQWLERFRERFGAAPTQWHSDLGERQRRLAWRAVAEGEARVVVGARSALFLPFRDLGLIVVDEEHEAAFKQEEGVIYHARDMAVVRARLGGIAIVLASATPSLETLVNASSGKYRALNLPDRHGGARLPGVETVDLRRERPPRLPETGQGWLSPPLRRALAETLAAGEQGLLFLNRRGYAPLTLCRACGHRLACPNCSAWLVEHRLLGRLSCHHCGYRERVPERCPACEAEGELAACGPGVERLEEELQVLFPEARRLVISSDSVRGPKAAAELIERIRAREVDLVIGTQMVAKGHHFPHLTCVGVVDADLGLGGGDLRAVERSYQLLHQVAGRAGRAERPGRVLLQTYAPEHPVMAALASGDGAAFLAREIEARRLAGLPPFGRLAALILADRDLERLEATAAALARLQPRRDGLEILGPAEPPLALLRGRHRRRFLVKARRDLPLQELLRGWLGRVALPGGLRLAVDIDPYSFL